MTRLQDVFFLPPLAIARLGGSDTPLEAFDWDTDVNPHGAHRTVIRPAVTLEVLADGSLRPYIPNAIRFRDGELLRPVAPFFELWAHLEGENEPRQVTMTLLRELGASLQSVRYSIDVANRKAERRTKSEACAFVARLEVGADDYERKPLLAFSPHNPNDEPMVFHDHPIPLGAFQVIRPLPRSQAAGVDLSALRVRFTSARGEVYGPPAAISGTASIVPPGPPSKRLLGGRLHDIVPPQNRILNGNTAWSRYRYGAVGQGDPQPEDSYDGAHEGSTVSWGVVDDTCDGVIQAEIVAGGERYTAVARVFSSCPDFAPDRRHFVSFADDLADREIEDAKVDAGTVEQAEEEIADLFARAFELVSQANLDASRQFAIEENAADDPSPKDFPDLPCTDGRTMTRGDGTMSQGRPFFDPDYADLFPEHAAGSNHDVAHDHVPYTRAAQFIHGPLTDVDTLIDRLRSKKEYLRGLIRPPFGRYSELQQNPDPDRPAANFRDPRVPRDNLQDMRMPPYMRDSDEAPLSLTWRQYQELMSFIDYVNATERDVPEHAPPHRRAVARLTRRVARDDRARRS